MYDLQHSRKRSAQLSALKPTTEGATGLGFGGAGQ
jgi:hypothetical protein